METFGYLHLYAFNEQEEIGEITFKPGKGLAALVLTGAALLVGVEPSQAYGVRPGSVGPAVADLQVQLNQAGIPVAVDGVFGPQTLAAVLQLQTYYGLAPDGIAGAQTLEVLCGCGFPNEIGIREGNRRTSEGDPSSAGGATYSVASVSETVNHSINPPASVAFPRQASSPQRSQQVPQRSQQVPPQRSQQMDVGRDVLTQTSNTQSYSVDIQEPVMPEAIADSGQEQEFWAQETTSVEEAQPYVADEQQLREQLNQGQLEGRLW